MAIPLARALRALLSLVPCLALAGVGTAQTHHWVDPLDGDDAHSGAAPDAAWQTITHALSVVPAGDVVHLAPGTYSVATGEVWPLRVTGAVIVGDAGSEATTLLGGWFKAAGPDTWFVLKLRGVTLRGGVDGVHIWLQHVYDVSLDLSDVRIRDMAGYGVYVDAWGGTGYGDARCFARLERVVVDRCSAVGVQITSSAFGGSSHLDAVLRDCAVRDTYGVRLQAESGQPTTGSVSLERCRIERSDGHGVVVWGVPAQVRDSLVAGCAEHGLSSASDVELDRCTLVDNAGAGVNVSSHTAVLRRSVLARNGTPIEDPDGVATVEHSCTDVGLPLPGLGNFVADPLFRDADAGDYALTFGSPCVDPDAPDAEPGALDLEGRARRVDGDLDALPRADLGALELHPLELEGTAALGTRLRLELSGPPGGSARVFFVAAALLDPGVPTPFGELALERTQLAVLGTVPTAPWPPGVLELAIPPDPALVGQTWSFQALAGTGGPAPPHALTNAVSAVILP